MFGVIFWGAELYPIPSMGLVYIPTFTIQINQMKVNIPYVVVALVFSVKFHQIPISAEAEKEGTKIDFEI